MSRIDYKIITNTEIKYKAQFKPLKFDNET